MGHRLPLRRAIGALKSLQGHGTTLNPRKAAAAAAPSHLVCNVSTYHVPTLRFSRFQSSLPEQASSQEDDEEMFSFPGLKVRYSCDMKFIPETLDEALPCYRLLCSNGERLDPSSPIEVDKEMCLKMYDNMVALQVMDTIFYDAQRQGRISFYVTTIGEEAINIASAAALQDTDVVFSQVVALALQGTPHTYLSLVQGICDFYAFLCMELVIKLSVCATQYREPGVLLWRGFSLQQFADQCYGNEADLGKGRQMPVHYGCNKLNYLTVSSPIATQIPQAVGAAYALKMDKSDSCAVTYFGDGGTSEGDFHAAMNFAAVLDAPVLFICRNNGYAISTPISEQFRSDGVAIKGQAYGIRSIRVDGNDALAVYLAVKTARKMAIEESRPILIEALTYRVGHHSTSDDSSKYRSVEEIEHWRTRRDPVARLRTWLQSNGWWNNNDESALRKNLRGQMMEVLQNAEQRKKPGLSNLFEDVYDTLPENLKHQEQRTHEIVHKYMKEYPFDIPLN